MARALPSPGMQLICLALLILQEKATDELIDLLENPVIENREAATRALIRLGTSVQAKITTARDRAIQDGNAELQARCEYILSIFRSMGYFPLARGHKWVYRSGRDDVVFEARSKEKVGDEECFVAVRRIGKDETSFYISVTESGLRIHRVGTEIVDPPYLEIGFPLKPRKWEWEGSIGKVKLRMECAIDDPEEVVVPHGKYRAYRIHEQVHREDGASGWTTLWLAEGVGVVKLQGKNADLHNATGDSFTWELKEFVAGK